MRSRRAWMFVASALLSLALLVIAGQGCGPNDTVVVHCPYHDGSGRYDPWCDLCAVDLTIKGCDVCDVDPELGPSFACAHDAGADAPADT